MPASPASPPQPPRAHGLFYQEYLPGGDGSNACPQGSTALTEAECLRMHREFGGVARPPERSSEDPAGCFRLRGPHNFWYYNRHPVGAPRPQRTVYCKSSRPVVAARLGAAAACPRGTGLGPSECLATAGRLGRPSADFFEDRRDHPRGCFRLEGPSRRFYFNNASRGGGAADPRHRPFCKDAPVRAVRGSGNVCPPGTHAMTISECRRTALHVGGKVNVPRFVINTATDPKGCFRWNPRPTSPGVFYYNTHFAGRPEVDRHPYCKQVAGLWAAG